MSRLPSRATIAHTVLSPLLPIWAVVALLPFGRSAEVGVVLAVIGCIGLFIRHPRALQTHAGAQLFLLLWGCYAAAAALSAVDAVNPGKSWGTVAATLRFVPLGVYVMFAVRRQAPWQRLHRGVAWVLAVWLLDAWIQALTGWSVGGAAEAERLSGMFGRDNLKLGPVLATLSPFLLQAARERWQRRGLVVGFLVLLVPILLAGSRASWLALALVACAFLWRETRRPLVFLGWAGAAALAAVLAAVVAWHSSAAFQARIQRTVLALQGSSQDVDTALAGRLQIWDSALGMIRTHPINGVGVRGFRYAYAEHAAAGDTFVQADGRGAAHAHQWVLEVLSETGAIGLLLWGIGIAYAVRAWRQATSAQRGLAFAPAVSLVAMAFPLNTHLAFYSAWWGLLFWWLIALYCAAISVVDTDEGVTRA